MTLKVAFANAVFTNTITKIISVELLHPCKATQITSLQIIVAMKYTFGNPALTTTFTTFDDSASTAYSTPGLCKLVYSLEPAADATAYGVSVQTGSLAIQVLTTDTNLLGKTISLTLVANVDPQQTAPGQTVTFTLEIICPPCTPGITTPTIAQLITESTNSTTVRRLQTDPIVTTGPPKFVYNIKTPPTPMLVSIITFEGLSNNNCPFETTLSPSPNATIFKYTQQVLDVDPVYSTSYKVASAPTL